MLLKNRNKNPFLKRTTRRKRNLSQRRRKWKSKFSLKNSRQVASLPRVPACLKPNPQRPKIRNKKKAKI